MRNETLLVFKIIVAEASTENNCTATYLSSVCHYGILGASVNLNMEMKYRCCHLLSK